MDDNYYQFKLISSSQKFSKARCQKFIDFFDELKDLDDFKVLKTKNDLIDRVSRNLLIKSKFELFDLTPVAIRGDGNCLYRSLSKALYGDQQYHFEVRYRTLVEMVMRKEEFLKFSEEITVQSKTYWLYHLSPGSDGLSPEHNYVNQLFECSKIDAWSTFWHVFAAAQCFMIDIHQVYPTGEK
ncbi:unnamed protein product [Brachionus calyciflorus]|uniref:OTU domain-containing protein n=1 Tax=Brachionus calyciflorus TaxID=104777 RepID=A0A814M1S5_9BILA|nr:unnamed protein product [Brachionus calyciflorus]